MHGRELASTNFTEKTLYIGKRSSGGGGGDSLVV
jgi:hypothetical protein